MLDKYDGEIKTDEYARVYKYLSDYVHHVVRKQF